MHSPEAHIGPHIPSTKGDIIEHLSLFGQPITTTIVSTWIIMACLFVIVGILFIAIRTNAFPRMRTFGLDAIGRLDDFLTDTIGSKRYARMFFPILGGFFLFIFAGNIFGLLFDWINLIMPSMHSYLRPINSDLNTTLVMAGSMIIIAQFTGMITKGFFAHWKHFLFNFSGDSLIEKIINVPVGWIHFIGEFTRVISLSVRLFANIFAGVIIISVMVYLGTMIPIGVFGGILTLPFWFFEIFVAGLQAFIFTILSAIYIQEAVTTSSH